MYPKLSDQEVAKIIEQIMLNFVLLASRRSDGLEVIQDVVESFLETRAPRKLRLISRDIALEAE